MLAAYYLVPWRAKNSVALIGSIFFYAWGEPVFVFLLMVLSYANYAISRAMVRAPDQRLKRQYLTLSLVLNVGALSFFKYANFLVSQVNSLLGLADWGPMPWREIALPIGVSFFTFQKISYMVDVYRGTARVARSFHDFALFVALFPQLIAGPIIRYHDVDEQVRFRTHTLEKFFEGLWRFSVGLAKKVLIANLMGKVADAAFSANPETLPTAYTWMGVLCYSLQIYFDFSGYSDMAIGLGLMMGFRFLENFRHPYISASVTEFWRRWHISLSNFMREYLYIPLGGNRGSNLRTYANLWTTFLLSGLWHGAAWNFVIWGGLHGLYLTLERMAKGWKIPSLPRPLAMLRTFVLVNIAWVFFRANSLQQACHYVFRMFWPGPEPTLQLALQYCEVVSNRTVAMMAIGILICLLPALPGMEERITRAHESRAGAYVRFILIFLLLFLSICSLVNSEFNPFIYFRF